MRLVGDVMVDLDDPGLNIRYQDGTRRIRSPEETLEFISPKLSAMGITRLADVTQLDRLGIHTCCAIRPTASVSQVSNGKGTSKMAAMVSAAMESAELFHAENPEPERFRYAKEADLDNAVVDHKSLNSFRSEYYFGSGQKIHWVKAKNAVTNEAVWVPAASIYFSQNDRVHTPSTNGLASGNHIIEAALHGLYEVIERDAGSLLSANGKIRLRERGRVVDQATISDLGIRSLVEAIDSESKLVLCHIESRVDVHTFWAILLNRPGGHPLTMLNPGWGTHRDMATAASRAITEAAQSRLTMIHGAREDIMELEGYSQTNVESSPAYRYFSNLKSNSSWADLPAYSPASDNLFEDWNALLEMLSSENLSVLAYDLSREDLNIPVVKIIVPRLGFNQRMF